MLDQEDGSKAFASGSLDCRTITLGQLCGDVGPELLEVITAPGGLEVAITGVAIRDELRGGPDHGPVEGMLMLGAGLPPDERLASALRQGPAPGFAAIACRAASDWPPALLAAAEATGVALLAVADHVEWGELYDLLRAALAADDLPGADEGEGVELLEINDLFQIAEATAAICGGPVTIDDMQSRILAFSGSEEIDEGRMATILNRRVPEQWRKEMRERGMIEALLSSDDVLRFDFAGLEPRRAIAIRLGESVIGSIWLAGGEGTLSPEADEALRRAAPLAATCMTRQRVAANVERRMREHRVATLLAGGEPSPRALERVGLASDEPLVVLALEGTARRASAPAVVGPRLIDLLGLYLQAYERPAVAASIEGRVYVLTTCRGGADRTVLQRIASECVSQAARTLGVELRAGIGHEVGAPAELPVARSSAEDCLALMPDGQSVAAFEDVHDRALLSDVEHFVEAWHAGPSSALRALAEHDEAHGTDYMHTLRCVLGTFGNAAQAAETLHLHVNTVRYRIRRIAEITGTDLADGDARLALELELRARYH